MSALPYFDVNNSYGRFKFMINGYEQKANNKVKVTFEEITKQNVVNGFNWTCPEDCKGWSGKFGGTCLMVVAYWNDQTIKCSSSW